MVFNTAFKPSRGKRERGKGYPEGFAKRKIVLIISKDFPKGVNEPDLRDILRDEWHISEPKGIKIHLAELEEKKALVKDAEKRGLSNIWKLSQEHEAFKFLVEMFHNSEDEIGLLRSKYAQSTINENFVDYFAASWRREFDHFFEPIYIEHGKEIKKSEPAGLRDEFYKYLGRLKKDDLIQILKLSPKSLHVFLFPEEFFSSLKPRNPPSHLDAFFLFSFVTDLLYSLPVGKGLRTKLEVEYGDVKKVDNENKVVPSMKAESKFEMKWV
jgi:hypothetical protein